MIRSLRPIHLQQDILQHCFLEMCEKPDELIIDLHQRGKLKNYFVKTLYNTARFSRTSFTREYGRDNEITFSDIDPKKFCSAGNTSYDTDDFTGIEGLRGHGTDGAYNIKLNNIEEIPQEEPEEIKIPLHKLYWYKAEILKLYAEHGTYQKVADLTQIPISSIYKTVQEARQELKKAI